MFTVDLNPIAVQIGPLAIHWYALAYLAGFLLGLLYLRQLIRARAVPMPLPALDDLLSASILGVLLGGRLGYVLFYDLPHYIAAPWKVLYLWQGGMSFHGGLIGVLVATLLFARRTKLPPLLIGDLLACAAPIGLFFGRLANFVNGELWGRPTAGDWGFIFLHAPDRLPRHPSQLYEAGLEGLLLFTLLWALAWFTPALKKQGLIGGIFLVFYASMRFGVEFFREPDAQLGFLFAGATMGQLLCVPMAALGLWILLRSLRQSREP